MKKTNEKYFVKIEPDFLFDTYKQFKSEYTPWIYLYLKLKYNYFITKAPNKIFEIDRNDIGMLYNINAATISRCFQELRTKGLLIQVKNKYRLLNEVGFIRSYELINKITEKEHIDHIQVYKNKFNNLTSDIQKNRPIGNTQRMLIKCLRIFFYLYVKNRHCFNKDTGVVDSAESNNSLSKYLKHDQKTVKVALGMLNKAGHIKLDTEVKISTVNKNTFDAEWDKKKVNNNNTALYENPSMESILQDEKVNAEPSGLKNVPASFIGYGKYSRPPYNIFIINTYGIDIVQQFWCDGDGIPVTEEEKRIQESLLQLGKKSRYYKPENYWLYANNGSSAKAA